MMVQPADPLSRPSLPNVAVISLPSINETAASRTVVCKRSLAR